ncbi:hypothetical protein [Glycomyces salinus]|uniref:hypothetical protein n=1 Tax=Glycomyces salinus TaxID=980294 RepID=UPI0018EC793C|nr:hypothetical protein [Glycomyces salinus]
MPSTTIRYPRLPENSREFSRDYPPGFGPGEPNYEPDHLRHRPGDDWQIGGRPYDPEDRGPYGAPGWSPDTRTGRHRRGELPDPPAESDSPHFSRPREEAFERYMRFSEPLASAHDQDRAAMDGPGRTVALLKRILNWLIAVIRGPEPVGAAQRPEGEYNLRRNPSNPPRPTSQYLQLWEARFDACHHASGNEVAL